MLVDIAVAAGIALLVAFASHSIIKGYVYAVIVGSLGTAIFYGMWSVISIGYFDPFLPIGCVCLTFYAFLFNLVIGLPFHRRRRPIPPYTCEVCGYCLKGFTEYRCPECGTVFADELEGESKDPKRYQDDF